MNLRQAAMSPVAVTIGETAYQFPKFTFQDWVDWTARVDAERAERALAGSTPEQRVQYATFYDILPTDLNEMRRRMFTPAGIQRICGTCMERGGVPKEQIGPILAAAHAGDLAQLVEELGDLESADRRAMRQKITALESDLSDVRARLAEAGKSVAPLPNSPPSTPSNASTG